MKNAAEFLEDYEVLIVETPENIELRLPLAGFGPRFLAQLIDGLIQGAIAFVLVLVSALSVYVLHRIGAKGYLW